MSELHWTVPLGLLEASIEVMRPHGAHGNEGLALWFGGGDERHVQFSHVVEVFGPGFTTTPLYMSLSMRAMAALTEFADRNGVFLAGQIHSHPGTFIDLSELDEVHGIRAPDYLSVVCPFYAQRALDGLEACGVHIFDRNRYRRLGADELRRRLEVREVAFKKVRLEVPA
jgi:proteasome lid subunit RPN8/RPN11